MWVVIALSLFYGSYNAVVVDVIDAETLTLEVAVWPGEQKVVQIGVLDVDTPSLNGSCEAEKLLAMEAIQLTRQFLGEQVVLADVRQSKENQLYYAKVRNKRGKSLGDVLIEVGYGVPSDENKKTTWCPKIP